MNWIWSKNENVRTKLWKCLTVGKFTGHKELDMEPEKHDKLVIV